MTYTSSRTPISHIDCMSRALAIFTALLISGCGSPTTPTPVTPNIAGQWRGTQAVTTCNETGAAVGSNFCANLGTGGTITFTPTQSGGNVSGTLGVGAINLNVSGTIDAAGVLVLAGTGVVTGATVTLNTWRSQVNGSTMTGPFTYTVLGGSPLGQANVSATATLSR